MALFGFPKLKIELDNVGSAAQDISAYVTTINGYTVEQILEELSAAGDATDRWAAVGFEQKSEIVLAGPYDDTANKLVAITKDVEGSTRTFKLTFDVGTDADTRQVEAIIRTTSRNPARAAFTQYEVTLRPTGAVT